MPKTPEKATELFVFPRDVSLDSLELNNGILSRSESGTYTNYFTMHYAMPKTEAKAQTWKSNARTLALQSSTMLVQEGLENQIYSNWWKQREQNSSPSWTLPSHCNTTSLSDGCLLLEAVCRNGVGGDTQKNNHENTKHTGLDFTVYPLLVQFCPTKANYNTFIYSAEQTCNRTVYFWKFDF